MKPLKNRFLVATSVALLLAPAAFAVDTNGTWTNTAGGSLSWDNSGNWAGNNIAQGEGFTADFSTLDVTADTTVALDSDRIIGNLTFGDTATGTAAGWIVAGTGDPATKLTLAGTSPTITVNALGTGKNTTITATLEGTSGFSKAGAGTLVLSYGDTATNISGPVVISAGILNVQGKPLNKATSVALSVGGTLISATAQPNAIGGTISFGGGTLQYNTDPITDYSAQFSTAANQQYRINTVSAGRTVTLSSNLSSEGGTLTKLAVGTLVLAAPENDYNGSTTISAGTLEVQGSIADSSNIAITAGASLVFNSASAQSYGKVISGGGTLAKRGVGTLTLSGANTYSGGTTISGGILSVGANNNLGATPGSPTTGNIVINGGTLSASETFTLNANRGIALGSATPSSGGTIDVVADKTLTYNGIIADNAGTNSLTKTGPGLLILNATNSYTGGTILNAGVLRYDNLSALSSGPISFTGNATLRTGVSGILANSISVPAGVTASFGSNNLSPTLSGAIAGDGSFTKVGNGTLNISGGNTDKTLSGPINVDVGTLTNDNTTPSPGTQSLANMNGPITVAAGATFNFSQSFVVGENLDNNISLSGNGTGGLGALNLYRNATASGTITLANDATISHNFNNATISGSITGTNRNLTLTTLTAGQAGMTVSGPISLGTGGITVQGVANSGNFSIRLSGNNSYTGETRVVSGTLMLSGSARINDAATVRIDSGGTPAAVLHLDFEGTDKVGALFLGGVEMPEGTYGAVDSGADNESAFFAGTGILQVGGAPEDNYASWASLNGVTEGENGDDDKDGVKNLVEYALADGAERGVLSGTTITFTKRGAPYGGDLTYVIETSETLSDPWTPVVTQGPSELGSPLSYDLAPTPGTPKKFVRLKVHKAP